jgi:hypothetical protein
VTPVGRLTRLFGKRSLDDRLLSGELSPQSAEGKKRAEQLLSRRHRKQSARALRELVEESTHRAPSLLNANLPIQARAVWANAELILALAEELEKLPAVDPRGVILADRLLTDGASPAYAAEDHGQLARAVERAREALHAG